ncbi:MAG: two-component regulator propeller domain-containing protein [Bacteroidota bacterium]
MRSPFIAALLWILCWSNCSLLHAQIRAFQHLDLSMENAPKGAVTCFQQDHQGFLWLGSSDGLFRYDGKAFQAFYHDPFDSTTLSNNFIKDIIEDRQGRLWVATRYGLNCYLPDRSVFVRYLQKESPHLELVNIVNSVLEDRPGKIWFSTLYGLFQMDVESGEQLHFLPEEENNYSIPHRSIWNLFEDQSGALWMGSNNGLVRYANDGSFRFECFLPDASTTTGLKTERVFNFYEQTNGILWMGTDQGLYRVNPTTLPLQFTELNHQAGMANSLSHRFVSALGGQGDEYLWAGTYAGGFNEIRLPQGPEDFLHFTHHRYQQNNPNSISSDKIESVFQDRTGVLWVSANVGVDFATPTTNKFDNVSPSLDDPTSLQGQVVTAMHRDKEGNLWVGTRKGLNFLTAENLAKGNFAFEFFQHQADDPRSISHSQISSIAEDSLGYVWIGTYRGLNYVHPKTFRQNRHFQYFDLRESGLSSNYIIAIHEIQKNEYWVGTFEGLNHVRFDPTLGGAPQIESFYQDDKLTKALGNSCITSLGKDRFGQYWVGTRGGLSKVIKQAGQYAFENYQYQPADKTSLRSNSVKALLLDRAGRLWVGTRGGLHLMVQESATSRVHFQSFGRKEGLSHEIIKAIVEDEQGQLWIPTNNGLFVFDPEQALADGPGIIKHYLVSDGLISASLNHQTIDADGNMYISGDNGFSYFHPARILENKHIPPVVFTELKILNKVVQPSSAAESILPKTINLTERIQLNYRQNAFSLKFAALDYSNPKKNQYAHQLVGFDPHWLYTGNDNTATYTNLPPGTYQLLAKGSNNDGIWNETPTRLTIEVLPPPWKTGWAYLIYVLLFGGLLSTFLVFGIRQWFIKF